MQNPGELLPGWGVHKLPPRRNAGVNPTSAAFIFLPRGEILQPGKDLSEDIALDFLFILFFILKLISGSKMHASPSSMVAPAALTPLGAGGLGVVLRPKDLLRAVTLLKELFSWREK